MRRPLPTLILVLGAGLAAPAATAGAEGLCELQEIIGPGGQALNDFGRGVAIGGGFAVIGTVGEGRDVEGSAHVYRLVQGGLTPQTVLHSGVVECGNLYGMRLATDGIVLAVADQLEGAPACGSGAVYVYRVENGTPVFEQRLTPKGAAFLGASLAVSGNLIVASGGYGTEGAAFVFRYANGIWNEEVILTDPVPGESNGFGQSVSIVGDVAVVGAFLDDLPGNETGAVYVYRYQGEQWIFEQKLKPPDAAPGTGAHWFGWSVALDGSGDTAVIGATQDLGQLGSAYVFEHDGSVWMETAKLQAKQVFGPSAFFGTCVAISEDGETILAGAPTDSEAGSEAGAAHLFRHIGNQWVELGKFTKAGHHLLGDCVALDGDLALVGAPGSPTEAAYLLAGVEGTDCNGNGQPDSCDIVTGASHDADGNGVPDECLIVGDVDGDGFVGIVDFLALLASWGPCPEPCPPSCPGDFGGDCAVGITDFLLLLGGWASPPPPPACPGSGDCCGPHPAAGCADQGCCDAVCTTDQFCCDVTWDTICVNEAQALCGCPPPAACGGSPDGSCCAFGGLTGPGCGDAICCEAICDYVDPFCCQVQWDGACALWALQFCACPPLACSPSAGDCCWPPSGNGGPGCNDLECCSLVCEQIDPFCCEAAWDAICIQIAIANCQVCGGP